MKPVVLIFTLAATLHAALVITGLIIDNLTSLTANFGGTAGFLPEPFHVLMGSQATMGVPEQTGGFGFFKWGVSSNFCTAVNFVTGVLGLLTFQYAHVAVLQGTDILNWIYIIITMAGYILFLSMVSFVFSMVLPFLRSPQGIAMVIGGSALFGLISGVAQLTSVDIASAIGCIPQ